MKMDAKWDKIGLEAFKHKFFCIFSVFYSVFIDYLKCIKLVFEHYHDVSLNIQSRNENKFVIFEKEVRIKKIQKRKRESDSHAPSFALLTQIQ